MNDFDDCGSHKLSLDNDDTNVYLSYVFHHILNIKLPDNCIDLDTKFMNGRPFIQLNENYKNLSKIETKLLEGNGSSIVEISTVNGKVHLTYIVNIEVLFVINTDIFKSNNYETCFDYKCFFHRN